jgi:hypothetical protein
MATTQKTTKVRSYGSYNFRTKDPVIDILRSLVDLEVRVQSSSFNGVLKKVADSSGLSYGCLLGWFYGATAKPYFCNVQRAAHALGVEFRPDAAGTSKRFPSGKH